MTESGKEEVELLNAIDLPPGEIGECRWDPTHNDDLLTVVNEGATVLWGQRKPAHEERYPPAWVPASTLLLLHSGTFSVDFIVDDMRRAQIGVGFLLAFQGGLFDWGFYGYLGAGPFAWAYDPSTGDVVSGTRSIQGGLPTFRDGRTGIVTVELHLPRTESGFARFRLAGQSSRDIALPTGAVVKPAACLLEEGQRITLAPLGAV